MLLFVVSMFVVIGVSVVAIVAEKVEMKLKFQNIYV